MTNDFTRRTLIAGAAAFTAAAALGIAPALASDTPPRALIAFDDTALAARAETLLRAKGFAVDAIDMRAQSVGAGDIGRAAVLVAAWSNPSEARAFARSTAVAFGVKFLVYGVRGWTHYVHAEAHEWREASLDEPRAALVLDGVMSDYLDRPRPMIRRV